jgi:hypothetical protein
MKKLISIKSDENGENIYFTHKNGVESVRKDDVIDLELLNPSKLRMTHSDGTKKLKEQIGSVLALAIAVGFFIWHDTRNYLQFTLFTTLICAWIFVLTALISIFSVRINTRNILKIYTKDKVLVFKILEKKEYVALYTNFKKIINKYFPKDDELIFSDANPKLKNYFIYLIVSDLIICGTLLYVIIFYFFNFEINYSRFFTLAIVLIGSIVLLIAHIDDLNFHKNYIRWYFKSKFLLNKHYDSIFSIGIYRSIFKENGDRILVSRRTELKQDNIIDSGRIAEEFRDIAPILIEYLNEISQNTIDVEFHKDREFVLEELKKFPEVIIYLGPEFKKDKEIILEAVKASLGRAFKHADASLKNDKLFVLDAVKASLGRAFKHADASLKNDKLFVLDAVKAGSGRAFKYADVSLKKDRQFVLDCVKQDGASFKYADSSLKKDRPFVLECVKEDGFVFCNADEIFRSDKEIILEAIKNNGSTFEYADDSLKEDRLFVLEVVKNDYSGEAFYYADDLLKKDRLFILEVVKNDCAGGAFYFADSSLKKDRRFVLECVKEDGYVLCNADEIFRSDKEIILEALKTDGSAFEFVDDLLKKDRPFVLQCVKENGLVLEYIDKSLQHDKEIVIAAIKSNSATLDFVDKSLKNDPEIMNIIKNQST